MSSFHLCYSVISLVTIDIVQSMLNQDGIDNPTPDYFSPLLITGPETTKSPSDSAVIANPYIGWFSFGITLRDKAGYYFSTTSTHNICTNPSNLTSYEGHLIATSYNYSTNNECARFYWFNQTEGKTAFQKSQSVDFTQYKVFGNPPNGYQVEKLGAASNTTFGSIYKKIPWPKTRNARCNRWFAYPDMYLIKSNDNNRPFSSRGDCGSIVFNRKDQFIIGSVIGGTSVNSGNYSIVLPFTYCYDGHFKTYYEQRSKYEHANVIFLLMCGVIVVLSLIVFRYCYRYNKKCKEDDAYVAPQAGMKKDVKSNLITNQNKES